MSELLNVLSMHLINPRPQPSPENYIAAGKRPLSSSSPVIVFDEDGQAVFVTGAAGGSRIITGGKEGRNGFYSVMLSINRHYFLKNIC